MIIAPDLNLTLARASRTLDFEARDSRRELLVDRDDRGDGPDRDT